ncbi:MAG TPA: hypothetical protein VF084_05280 [Nitrososphaeraceae archaeon]
MNNKKDNHLSLIDTMEYINRKKIIESYIIYNNVIIRPTLDLFVQLFNIIHDIRTGINESNTG